MSTDGLITVRGARENNLRGVDADLKRGSVVVLAGPSGSGKSSLAFDTLHAEGRRRYLEALAGQVRGLGQLQRPAADVISGLPPTIALDQRAAPPAGRSTVATWADVEPALRVLYARGGEQRDPASGEVVTASSHDEIVAALLALPEGTRLLLEAPLQHRRGGDPAGLLQEVTRAGFSRVRVRGEVLRVEDVRSVAADADLRVVVDRIKVQAARSDRLSDAVRTASLAGRGVLIAHINGEDRAFTDRPYSWQSNRELPWLEPALFNRRSPRGWCPTCRGAGRVEEAVCGDCEGVGLCEAAQHVFVNERSLPELLSRTVAELAEEMAHWPSDAVTTAVREELERRVGVLVRVGLGHLPLAQDGFTLSSGEQQRLRLARQIGSQLSGVLYVLDEPSAGLGDADVQGVIDAIHALRNLGNTLLVVEHHPAIIEAADEVIEFGPGPGRAGGQIVFRGSLEALRESDTATGRWISGREALPASTDGKSTGAVVLSGLTRGNLKLDEVSLPLGLLVALSGPSGAGKSSLLETAVEAVKATLAKEGLPSDCGGCRGAEAVSRVVHVDRGHVRRSPRSNPATYVGLWDTLRELLAATTEAKVRGLDASMFSLNLKGGRCEVCKGTGVKRIDLDLLADVFLPCEVCGGQRFTSDVLEVRWRGHTPHELLQLTVADAYVLLAGHPKLAAALRALQDVGLGYLALGQSGHTLSGGEAQRLKLARELSRAHRSGVEGTLYVLDDPSVGLHPSDTKLLVELLQRLVHEGATVWMATHHEGLATVANHRVRLGPGAGTSGGQRV